MPRFPQKSQYKKCETRVIFLLRSPRSMEFYIGHCKPDSLMPIFRQHCAGDRYHTNVCFLSLKQQGLHPCLTILEEINSTQVEAYTHVIAWTKLFVEEGYISLNRGNIMDYIDDLFAKSQAVYNEFKNSDLKEICNCKNCIVKTYGRKQCPFYSGDINEK